MDIADKEALARRAVECTGFRWAVGMLDPELGAVNVDDGGTLFFVALSRRGDIEGRLNVEDAPNARPDLAHDGTLGCLLARARELWGRSGASLDVLMSSIAPAPGIRVPFVTIVAFGSGGEKAWTTTATGKLALGESIVNALEGAP